MATHTQADLKVALAHVLWIGGTTDSGKTSVARVRPRHRVPGALPTSDGDAVGSWAIVSTQAAAPLSPVSPGADAGARDAR